MLVNRKQLTLMAFDLIITRMYKRSIANICEAQTCRFRLESLRIEVHKGGLIFAVKDY